MSSTSDFSDAWEEYEYLGNSINVRVPALVAPANIEPQLPAGVSVNDFHAYMPMHPLDVPHRAAAVSKGLVSDGLGCV